MQMSVIYGISGKIKNSENKLILPNSWGIVIFQQFGMFDLILMQFRHFLAHVVEQNSGRPSLCL